MKTLLKKKQKTKTNSEKPHPAFPAWHHLGFDTRFLFSRTLLAVTVIPSLNYFDNLLLENKYKLFESVSIYILKTTTNKQINKT